MTLNSDESMIDIQKRIEKEAATESMLEAKGFGECYVRIDDDSVDVMINKSALTDSEITQIEDIVKRQTSWSARDIKISIIKK